MKNIWIAIPSKKNDTLVGIALKFGISVSELQKLNRLPNQGIFHLKTLLVPMKNEEISEKLVKSQNETDHQHILIQFQKKRLTVRLKSPKFTWNRLIITWKLL